MKLPAEQWFSETIKQGLARSYVQGLVGTPSEEVIKVVRQNWVEDLWTMKIDWDEEQDAERIAQAFADLRRTAQRWIQIPDFIAILQPRAPVVPVALLDKPKVELTGEPLRAKQMGLRAYLREVMEKKHVFGRN